VQFNYRKVKI